MNDQVDPVVAHLQYEMERCEADERRLKAAEERRQRGGTYERLGRRILTRSNALSREAPAAEVARLHVALHRAKRGGEVDVAAARTDCAIEAYEAAHGFSMQAEQVRQLEGKPSANGRLARPARWAKRDLAMEFVRQRWQSQAWRSKAEFARLQAPQVIEFAEKHGYRMSEHNAERTIREWVTDKESGTPSC